MLSISDAWIKAAFEQRTLEIVYVKANAVHETIREVEPSFAGWDQNSNVRGLFGHCYLRDQVRCFKPERVWRWKYIGASFQSLDPIDNELNTLYNDRELENQTWDENQGEDYGYQQFLEFERNLTRNACTEIKETIIEQNPSSHLIIQLENYMRSDMSIRVSVIDSLLRIYFEEAIVQANQEDKEIIEIIKKRLEPST
jgi:hypothetical protein